MMQEVNEQQEKAMIPGFQDELGGQVVLPLTECGTSVSREGDYSDSEGMRD